MTEEEVDPAVTTTYHGRTIAFCCDTCLGKFRANPDRYVARLAALPSDDDATPASPSTAHHDDSDAHDHSPEADSLEVSSSGEGNRHEHGDERPPWLARTHPVLVHFPLAGIPLALAGFLLWRVTGKEAFAAADAAPLFGAAAAAIAAVITGNLAHNTMRFAPSLHDYVGWHQYAGTMLMVLALVLSALRIWRWKRLEGVWLGLYAGGLLLAALLVGLTGYLGGSLVFGPDHLAW